MTENDPRVRCAGVLPGAPLRHEEDREHEYHDDSPNGVVRTARGIGTARTVRPAILVEPAANTATAIERQLDEIQHTFSVRWEW